MLRAKDLEEICGRLEKHVAKFHEQVASMAPDQLAAWRIEAPEMFQMTNDMTKLCAWTRGYLSAQKVRGGKQSKNTKYGRR